MSLKLSFLLRFRVDNSGELKQAKLSHTVKCIMSIQIKFLVAAWWRVRPISAAVDAVCCVTE